METYEFSGDSLENLKENLCSAFPHSGVAKDCCINCGEAFSETNTFISAGWKETRISQMCELCFDALFEE